MRFPRFDPESDFYRLQLGENSLYEIRCYKSHLRPTRRRRLQVVRWGIDQVFAVRIWYKFVVFRLWIWSEGTMFWAPSPNLPYISISCRICKKWYKQMLRWEPETMKVEQRYRIGYGLYSNFTSNINGICLEIWKPCSSRTAGGSRTAPTLCYVAEIDRI